MKKFLLTLAIILTLTGCVGAAEITRGYITVNTEATEELSPTLVKISFAINTESKDPQIVADLNKQASNKVISAVKGLVDTSKGESIRTVSYYLNPEYNYKDGTKKLMGYTASNTLQVSLKDMDKAGKVISTALSNGANSVSNLQFVLEETNDSCNKLIQVAAKGARERADKVAQSMGTSVSGIRTINASCSSSRSVHTNFRLMKAAESEAAMDNAMGASMPVEAGKTQLRAYVNADFFVK